MNLRGFFFNKTFFIKFFTTNTFLNKVYIRDNNVGSGLKDSFVDCFFLPNADIKIKNSIPFFIENKALYNLNNHYYNLMELLTHLFTLKHYIDYRVYGKYLSNSTVSLNYKRRNFFPFISSSGGRVILFSSLGLFSKMFNKPKAFIRNKLLFLLTSSFFRKVLLFSGIKHFNLKVKRKPIYLQEFINTLFIPNIALYKHPFTGDIISEKLTRNPFYILNYVFINNKNFSYQKTRLKGRIKRRIGKRLVKMNNVLD